MNTPEEITMDSLSVGSEDAHQQFQNDVQGIIETLSIKFGTSQISMITAMIGALSSGLESISPILTAEFMELQRARVAKEISIEEYTHKFKELFVRFANQLMVSRDTAPARRYAHDA